MDGYGFGNGSCFADEQRLTSLEGASIRFGGFHLQPGLGPPEDVIRRNPGGLAARGLSRFDETLVTEVSVCRPMCSPLIV